MDAEESVERAAHVEVADLTDKVRREGHRGLVVELRQGTSRFDKAAGRRRDNLDLCVISEGPGWHDSRYYSAVVAEVPATDEPERIRAAALARSLADRLGLPCDVNPPGGEPGRPGLSRWIQAQGPAPAVGIEVRWEAGYWLDEGLPRTADGVETLGARSGADACAQVTAALHARLGSDDGPVDTVVRGPMAAGWTSRHSSFPRRGIGFPLEEAWALRRAGRTPAQILRAVCERYKRPPEGSRAEEAIAEPTGMALMWLMHQAFGLGLPEWAEIGTWRAGRLPDDSLDEVLGRRIGQAEHHWNLPERLRYAHRSGGSVAAVLRAEHTRVSKVLLIRHLREALNDAISLQAAKRIVETLHTHNSHETDALLNTALDGNDAA